MPHANCLALRAEAKSLVHAGTALSAKVRRTHLQARSKRYNLIRYSDDTFLCSACEASNKVIKGKHKLAHGLVLCQPPRDETDTDLGYPAWLGRRMDALEGRFDKMSHDIIVRFDTLSKKVDVSRKNGVSGHETMAAALPERSMLQERVDGLDERMQRIETMLSVLVKKLG